MQGRIGMQFLEIISADVVFKFCRYKYTYTYEPVVGTGESFKGKSKEAERSPPPPLKRPKMAQNQHIPQYSKITKQPLFIKDWSILLTRKPNPALPRPGTTIRVLNATVASRAACDVTWH